MSTQSFYANVHNSVLHNSQKVEAPQMFISEWWINKMCCLPTLMEYYSPVTEALTHTTT